MIKVNHLFEAFLMLDFEEYELLLHCDSSLVHSEPGGVVPDRVLSMGQIELFDI